MSLQTLLPVILFLIALACVPFLIRWLKSPCAIVSPAWVGHRAVLYRRLPSGRTNGLLTVEVGPMHNRVWLTLGVTRERHSMPAHCRQHLCEPSGVDGNSNGARKDLLK